MRYDEGLRKISKGCTTKVLERAAATLQEYGISNRCVFSFVIGFPFETREDCEKTIHFATNLLMNYNVRIYLQWCNTIPGSKIWSELHEQGKVDIWMYDDFGFFSNKYLFKSGVPLSNRDIEELSDTIRSINTMLMFTKQSDDIIQFARPDWLLHTETLDFPSHDRVDGRCASRADPGYCCDQSQRCGWAGRSSEQLTACRSRGQLPVESAP